jgi:anti-anti-sigma factor
MDIATEAAGDKLEVKLDGRLDATTAPSLDAKLALDGVREIILDFAKCHYISSAGIRSVLKAHQAMAKAQGKLVVTNVSPHVREVFDLTGLSDMITIGKKTREISIEGLELLSAGVCGECYRLDHETVVKVYNEGVGPEIAEREKQYSKAAFVMGVPTAISYDVVSCGTRSGVVYELLDAELFSAVIRKDLGNLDHHAKMLSDTAKTLHAATGDKNVLPDLKDRFRGYRNCNELNRNALSRNVDRKLIDRSVTHPDIRGIALGSRMKDGSCDARFLGRLLHAAAHDEFGQAAAAMGGGCGHKGDVKDAVQWCGEARRHGLAVHKRVVAVERRLPQRRDGSHTAHPIGRKVIGDSVQVRESQPAALVVDAARFHLRQRAGWRGELFGNHAGDAERFGQTEA